MLSNTIWKHSSLKIPRQIIAEQSRLESSKTYNRYPVFRAYLLLNNPNREKDDPQNYIQKWHVTEAEIEEYPDL